MKHIIYILILSLAYHSYGQEQIALPTNTVIVKKSALTELQKQSWWAKDYLQDTIPGISLDKAYNELLKDKKGREIIVAVIDTKLDIKHEDIKNQIWVNTNETPNNGIDDDQNGYIDDIHGWNYLGNLDGEEIIYSNYESMRIIKMYDSIFKNIDEAGVPTKLKDKFVKYQKAIISYETEREQKLKIKERLNTIIKDLPKTKSTVQSFFGNKLYTVTQLDSLLILHKKDSVLSSAIKFMKKYKQYGITEEKISKSYRKAVVEIDISLNFEFNDRDITNDDPNNIKDITYGNSQVWNDSIPFQHAILVSGVIAGDRNNTIGVRGVSNSKIMSLCVASSGGDEHDKDIALAIRYAVDNGAKIINMSFGKPLSLKREWVDEALKHAASKEVLVVCSAGNGSSELNLKNIHYPTNYDPKGNMIVNNVLKVGATSKYLDKKFIASFSNYSDEYMDLFAPGVEIYTTKYNNEYGFSNGTSYSAPIVSGVAALIWSYYPSLTVSEVKKIIIQSGVSYDLEVEIKQLDGTKKLVPFSELSKSGKIVNAYNALLMAERMFKAKE